MWIPPLPLCGAGRSLLIFGRYAGKLTPDEKVEPAAGHGVISKQKNNRLQAKGLPFPAYRTSRLRAGLCKDAQTVFCEEKHSPDDQKEKKRKLISTNRKWKQNFFTFALDKTKLLSIFVTQFVNGYL